MFIPNNSEAHVLHEVQIAEVSWVFCFLAESEKLSSFLLNGNDALKQCFFYWYLGGLDEILTSPLLQIQVNKQTQADAISMSQPLRFKDFIHKKEQN